MPRDIVKRLRDYADNPTQHGFVPVSPVTLREAADEIDRLREAQSKRPATPDRPRPRVFL